jgi:hypothetical protein
MASNLWLMSSAPNFAVEPESAASNVAKPERLFAGFPWVSAIVLYTLSWGWSLLRPNTLYWDDWSVYFNQPSGNGIAVMAEMGRPPWGGVIEYFLLQFGVGAVTVATFLFFFVSSVFMFGILRRSQNHELAVARLIVLMFLVVPVNSARTSVAVFDYTSSYILFYFGWFVLVNYKSTKSFLLSSLFVFLSFKTHSFLFFVLLPLLNFTWLNKTELLDFKHPTRRHIHVVILTSMPFLYFLLRQIFWPTSEAWAGYQKPSKDGIILWAPILAPFVLGLILILLRRKVKKSMSTEFLTMWLGMGVIALALLPYFVAGLFRDYISLIAFRSDWSSRHQLLMPLGLALSVVGLNELLKWRGKNVVVLTVLVISVGLNMFWGSQYFLQSHKQEQLVELFKTTKSEVEIASVEDQTKRFNGRESTFRSYEWTGFMTLAGISTDRPGCEALPSGSALTLKSDTSYLQALATRDLGLYFEIKPCSEVLAQNN